MPSAVTPAICVALSALVGLSACAGTEARSSTVSWRKAGASEADLRAEYGLCGGDFDRLGRPTFDPAAFAAIDACMRAKGFERVSS